MQERERERERGQGEGGRGEEARREGEKKRRKSDQRSVERGDNKAKTLSTTHTVLRRFGDKYSFSEQRSVALQDRTVESFSS